MSNNKTSKTKLTAGNLHKHLCPLFISIAGILAANAEAATVPDASQSKGPTMGQAANGTPVVNITDPNAKGVSHNKFDQFNVDKNGLIFNNSMQDGVSKIGGYTVKNAQLEHEAKAIISEVTGAQASYINGTMEVFGRKADVIVANQNGISVNGATTINANSLTLSTGKVQMKEDGNYKLAVEKGTVSLTGQGISTEGLSYFDIVSRSAKLEGEIAGQADVKVVAGQNDYDLSSRQHTTRATGDGHTPDVAIDGRAMGSMYGGKIQLISTESGAGVRHEGSIIATGDIEISANGDVTLTGLRSDKNVTVSGNNIALNKNSSGTGSTEAQNNIILHALSGMTVNNDVISRNGTIRIDASTLLQNTAAIIAQNSATTAVPAIQINVAGQYTLSGKLKALDANGAVISGGVVTLKNGDFVVIQNGQQVPFSTLVSDAEIVSNSGNVNVTAGSMTNNEGVILAKKGTLQFNLTGAFENKGSVSATGDIWIASGSMKNNGILYASNAQTLSVGHLDNAGRLYADKNLIMTASALNNSGHIGANRGEMRIMANGEVSNSGTLSGNDALIFIDADGNIVNDGTIASNKHDVTLASGGDTLSNTGRIAGRNVSTQTRKASATVSNTGTISASEKLAIATANLKNQAGTLSATTDMQLDVKKELQNSQKGSIIAGKNLTIKGDGALAVHNDDGLIQGDNINASGITTLSNTHDALIAARENLSVTATSLLNDASTIQAGSLTLDRVSTVDNLNAATLYASKTLQLTHLNTLNNTGSFVISDGTLSLSDVNTLNNTEGATLFGAGNTTLRNVGTLNNSGASMIKSDNALSIATTTTLNNSSDAVIASEGNLNISGVKTLNNRSVIIGNGNIAIDAVEELKNDGVVQAGLDLIIRNVKNLANTGEGHVLAALRNLTIEDVESLINSDGAVISANMQTVLNAIGVLTNRTAGVIQAVNGPLEIVANTLSNIGSLTAEDGQQSVSTLVAGGDITINAQNMLNTEQAVIVSTQSDLSVNVANNLINANAAVLSGANNTNLNVAGGTISNEKNALIAGNNITINASQLNNHDSGTTSARNDLNIHTGSFNNINGILEAGHDLLLKVKDSIALNDNNRSIRAGHDMTLSTEGTLFNNTMMEAIGNLTLQADGKVINSKSVVTGGDLRINANEVMNNSNSLLWSLGKMDINAHDGAFVNDYNGNVLSMGDMSLIAKTIINSAGIIRSEQNINIDAASLENQSTYTGGTISQTQTQDAVGQWAGIDNVMTQVRITTVLHIPVLASDIAMSKLGEISAGKDININQRGIFDEKEVKNNGGLIQAGRDITITGNLLNSPTYTSESMYDYLNLILEQPIVLTDYWKVAAEHYTTLTFNSLYQYLDFIFGDGAPATKSGTQDPNRERSYKSLLDAANDSTQLNYVMSKVFGETWNSQDYATLNTAWHNLVSNDTSITPLKTNMIYFVPSEKGEITAGRNFTHNGGTLDNGLANAGTIKENAKIENIDVGDYTIDTAVAGYDVAINTKKLNELAMGISPLPTIKDLVSLPGMFEVTDEFKKASEAAKNGTEYSGPANHIIPIFETRPEMIDQSKYSGSDYYFDKVDYTTTETVNVIGDNYFISELIRREISRSVGSMFAIRDGLEGDALVQNLMDNAGIAAKNSDLNLVVGQPLSEEQRNELTQDIVWFVSQNIKGTEVLVPVVYLCPETLSQLANGDISKGTASIAAGNSLSVDATAINNVNGTLSSKGDVTLKSKGDINNISNATDAGISAGGNVSMTSENGSIASNGAAVNAGGDIDMKAEKGDITLTASVGHGEDGKQKIHAHDDGVTAGGSINMQAKTITSNAADITAGQDVNMKASEGDVTFNDLHQIDSNRTINTEINGLSSYTTTDTKTVTGEAIGATVKAGGNVQIDASKNVVIEGGSIDAKSGSINAAENVEIKTSENVSAEEHTTQSRQFVAEAGISGAGKSASASYGKNEGTTKNTTSGDYTSAGGNSETSAIGAKPGRAPITDTAGFRVGMEDTTDTVSTQSKQNTNASINFTDSGSVNAGKTADIGGADLSAGDKLSINAKDVASTKYEDETKTTVAHKDRFVGVSGEAHSAVVDAIDKTGNLIDKSQQGQSINSGTTTAEVLGDVSNIMLNDLAGGSVTFGGNTTKTKETRTATAENTNNINAKNVSINSTNDTTLNGVNVNSQNTEINAGGNVDINAAKSTTSYTNETEKHKGGLTAGVGVDITGASGGISVDYNGSTEHGSGNSTSYKNSTINGNTVTVNAGGDMNMKGANIDAEKADVNVAGDMNITSVQNTEHTESSRGNWGASVGISVSAAGIIPNASVNGGGGSESYDSSKTAKQSGINTSGELNVKTGGDLNMTGANLVSQDGTGSVNVAGDINAKTLEDHVEQDGLYGGGGIGLSNGVVPSGNIYVDTVDEIHYNETQKSTIAVGDTTSAAVNGDLNTHKDEMSVVTRDEKEAGNNISYTLADPGIRKKKKSGADADSDTPVKPDDGHTDDGGCPQKCTPTKPGSTQQQTTTTTRTTSDSQHMTIEKTTATTTSTSASSVVHKAAVASETARSEAVPNVAPSTSQPLTPKAKPEAATVTPKAKPEATTVTPVKKWAVPETNYPVLSPGSATGKTGKDMPKTPDHRKWNGDMTNGVAPSSNTKGDDVKLSPGSSTGQTGMDMPKTPEHKQWNGDMTNGVAPSSNTKGNDVKLSPGSSTGQTGMDMPKTPEHKKWNGDMSKGAMNARPQWKALQIDRPIDIYAPVTITFTDEQYS
ncbi:hemagglutination protein [Enterobacter roggenkampii]|uniref:two-partner secretion domain-containing protein n=1 Tax=Enterobacter roggenkampii TaxID=1812935 RepID=UPI0007B35E57|nr:hemagglutinin repeat-containing protein [Enterobacter roggenkampii]KZP79641.1 hemagglutination protein [Enterobacter roggenkampii]